MSSEVQQAPAITEGRAETGQLQFGDDWPGIFIRGDNAVHYSMSLNTIMQSMSKQLTIEFPYEQMVLNGLMNLLNEAGRKFYVDGEAVHKSFCEETEASNESE